MGSFEKINCARKGFGFISPAAKIFFVLLALSSAMFATDISSCPYTISSSGTYDVTADLSTTGTCISIEAQNVTLDCNGFSITGDNSADTYGIYSNQFNSTIKNCQINLTRYGIYLDSNANSSLVQNNTIYNATMGGTDVSIYGIYVAASRSIIHNNTIRNLEGSAGSDYVGTSEGNPGADTVGIYISGIANNLTDNRMYDFDSGNGGTGNTIGYSGGNGGPMYMLYFENAEDNFANNTYGSGFSGGNGGAVATPVADSWYMSGHGAYVYGIHIHSGSNNTVNYTTLTNANTADGQTCGSVYDNQPRAGDGGHIYGAFLNTTNSNHINFLYMNSLTTGDGGSEHASPLYDQAGKGGLIMGVYSNFSHSDVISTIVLEDSTTGNGGPTPGSSFNFGQPGGYIYIAKLEYSNDTNITNSIANNLVAGDSSPDSDYYRTYEGGGFYGLFLKSSNRNLFENNTITNIQTGSSGDPVSPNYAGDAGGDIYLAWAGSQVNFEYYVIDNIIRNNSMYGNTYGSGGIGTSVGRDGYGIGFYGYFYNLTVHDRRIGEGNQFYANNLTASVWVDQQSPTSNISYNVSGVGNIWYKEDGTASWDIYDLTDSNGDGWADGGDNWPFNATNTYNWTGYGDDWRPYIPPPSPTAPNITNISVYPSIAYSNTNLSCNVTAVDNTTTVLDVSVAWFKNGVNQTSLYTTLTSVSNNTWVLASNISSGNTSDGENWSCYAYATDGSLNSEWNMSSNITILPGTVSACGTLSAAGTTYNLTQDVSVDGDTCFTITAENITLNCAGFSITGNNTTATYGAYSNQYNTTIKNCIISNFSTGIYIDGVSADRANITNNTIRLTYSTSCADSIGTCNGISLNAAGNSTIENNSISAYQYGLNIYNANNNTLQYNNATSAGDYAIYIYNANNNTLQYNNATSTNRAIYAGSSSNNTIQYNNAVAGGDYAIYFSTSTNNTLSHNIANTTVDDYGIYLSNSDNNNLDSNTVYAKDYYGIYLSGSDNNNITNNDVETDDDNGIYLTGSTNNTVINNTVDVFDRYGIYLFTNSHNNTVQYNNATAGNIYAIYIQTSSNNTVQYNNATTISRALALTTSTNNIITQNYLQSSSTTTTVGTVHILTSNDNIFSNNIINQSASGSDEEKPLYITSGSHNIFYNNTIISASSDTTPAIYIAEVSSNNTFYNNSITAPVWVNDLNASNYYNYSGVGNIYYYKDGTAAYTNLSIFDIDGDGWADSGDDLPLNATTLGTGLWAANGEDWHPYSESGITNAAPNISSISVYPSTAFANNSLSCNITAVDNETAVLNVSIAWFKNGENQTSLYAILEDVSNATEVAASNISSGNTSAGENWSCYAYATDGLLDSLWNMSENLTISEGILDSCANIATAGMTYNLSQNISINGATCINISAANITLDCAGFSITGSNTTATFGVYSNQLNTTIKNCVISNFSTGIYINGDSADFANITNNSITLTYSTSCSPTNGACNAIFLNGPDNSVVQNNSASAYQYTLSLYGTTDSNTIQHNYLNASYRYGIRAESASSNTFQYNYVSSPGYGIYVTGGSSNIIQYNNVSVSLYDDALYLASTSSNTVQYNNLTTTRDYALHLHTVSGNTISQNYMQSAASTGGSVANFASSANTNIFSNNTLNNTNSGYAIFIGGGTGNTFYNNTILTSSALPAIYIVSPQTGNTFYYNNITGSNWVSDAGSGNFYNYSGIGNIYYFSNGVGAWEVYDAIDASGDTWADAGSNVPFDSSLTEWTGSGNDSHPYTTASTALSACANLSIAGATYTMQANASATGESCFNITATNITLDCNGFSITGNSAAGMVAVYSNSSNTTIKNCVISGFANGIAIEGDSADYANISDNNITITYSTSCTADGGVCSAIYLEGADYSIISGNKGTSNKQTITLYGGASFNTIEYNSFTATTTPVAYLYSSSGNTIQYSNFTAANNNAFYLTTSSNSNVLQFNRISSSSSATLYILSSSTNNTIQNNSISTTTYQAIYLIANSNIIRYNNITGTYNTIRLFGASSNNITGNYIRASSNNPNYGSVVVASSSNSNTLWNNLINSSSSGSDEAKPVYLNSGNHNQFYNNTIISSSSALTPAIYIDASQTNNTFYNNSMTAPMWVNDSGTGNYFNYSGVGNIYYYSDGTAAYTNLSILDADGDGWADTGNNLPFSESILGTLLWDGASNDSHPYTLNIDYAPHISFLNLSPTSPTNLQNLSCNITAYDNQTTSLDISVEWYANGTNMTELFTTLTGVSNNTMIAANLSSGNLSAGENWSCRASANDGILSSGWNISANVTIIASNTAPNISAIAVYPASPTDISNLSCNITATDNQTSTLNVSIAWFKNGVNQTSLYTALEDAANGTEVAASNISYANLSTGENWSCQAYATDGLLNSAWSMGSNVTIADGESIMDCKNLSTAGITYTLLQNVSIDGDTCFTISTANVTLDCAGFSITGNNTASTKAVYSDQYNTTIKNCVISNFSTGIYINGDSADFANITNNTITLDYSTSCSPTNGACNGIFLYSSDNASITNNSISAYKYSLNAYFYSQGHLIEYNNLSSSSYNVLNIQTSSYSTVQHNNLWSANGETFFLYNSDYLLIQNNTISSEGYSTLHIRSNNAVIQYNNITGATYKAVEFEGGSNNVIANNYFESSYSGSSYGTVYLSSSNSNIFSNNTINETNTGSNIERPIYLRSGSHNQFYNNTIISASSATPAIHIFSGNTNNTFYNNSITAPVWVYDNGAGNYYNYSSTGNIYYYKDGTAAYSNLSIFDIDGDGWADSGSALPFSASTLGTSLWTTNGSDYHPYTLNTDTAPNISSISAYPASPISADNLSCNITATDNQTSTLNVSIAWFKNGENQTSLYTTLESVSNGTEIAASNITYGNTSVGENWSCYAYATDGLLNSQWSMSANITIASAPPENLSGVIFTNASAGHWFLANATASDGDGADTLNWSATASSGTCTNLSNTTSGATLVVSLNCTGTALESALINFTFIDVAGSNISTWGTNPYPNNAPNMTNVSIYPAGTLYKSTDHVMCNATAEDADGDSITYYYQWYINNISTIYTDQNLSNAQYGKGDWLKCGAIAGDSYQNSSETNSSEVQISNSLPSVQNISFTNRTQMKIVQCMANVTDGDGQDDLQYINFTITNPNGTIIVNNINGTRNGSTTYYNSSTFNLSVWGSWNCSITATDLSNASITVSSTSTVIREWQKYYGGTLGELRLGQGVGDFLVNWSATHGKTVYVAEPTVDVAFTYLYPLGLCADGSQHTAAGANDFAGTDSAWSISAASERTISEFFDADGDGVADESMAFSVFGRNITGVPIARISPSSPFATGIFWQGDSTSTCYQAGSDDVVFAVTINASRAGVYGTSDYELMIPAELASYKDSSNNLVAFYGEYRGQSD